MRRDDPTTLYSMYVDIKNCVFKNNTSGNGGALTVTGLKQKQLLTTGQSDFNATARVFNCTFINNRAQKTGGAIFATDASLIVESSAITSNVANQNGGGVALDCFNFPNCHWNIKYLFIWDNTQKYYYIQ